ncbi:CKLF-like MARVEL transmembrane domain-containing protein 4 [Babylonia areolata]|uniref:CKLF-like MARVEL transmembrane domain-containing protein 4 n=1 Tax=Babylonia areolata TaxID=304850 RepID=UPI003FD4C696
MADSGHSQPGGHEDGDIMYIWKIPIDRAYVKSIIGILKFVIAILSLIAFICCASGRSDNCDDKYSSTYNYYEFVSISCFLTIVFLWFFFVLTLHQRLCFKIIPWQFAELVYLAVYAIFYFIAAIVIAAQSCGKDSNKAASAFGFFTLIAIGGHGFLTFRAWWAGRKQSAAEAAPKASPQYDPDRNMELY